MIGINGSEFIILAVLAIVILGPEKLPEYTRAFTDWLRVMRDKAEGAKAQFKEETGTDFDEVDWRKYDPRQYDPRRIIRDALREPAGGSSTPAPSPTPEPTWTCWNGSAAYAYDDCSLPTGFGGLRWVFPASADVACLETGWSQGAVVAALQCRGDGWVMVLRQFTSPQAGREYYRDFAGSKRAEDWSHGFKWRSQDGKDQLIHKAYSAYPYGYSARGDSYAKAQRAMEVFRPVRQPERMRGRPR